METGLSLREHAELIENYLQSWDDRNETIDSEAVKQFNAGLDKLQGSLAEKTDKWISFIDDVLTSISTVKAKRKKLAQTIKAFTSLLDNSRRYIKMQLEAYPYIRFKGDFGSIFLKKTNSRVEIGILEIYEKNFNHLIDPEYAYHVDADISEFLDIVTVYQLNMDRVRKALEEDPYRFKWARLVNDGPSVSIPKLTHNEVEEL